MPEENGEMSKEKILRKLQGVLARTKSSNPHEAAVAAGLLKKLMDKYDIHIHQLELIQKKVVSVDKKASSMVKGRHPRKWVINLASAVSGFYECKLTWRGATFSFIGFEVDSIVALQMFEYLYSDIRRTAVEKCDGFDRHAKQANVQDFCIGATVALEMRFEEMKVELRRSQVGETKALVVVKKNAIDEFMKALGKLRVVDTSMGGNNTEGFIRGVQHGRTVPLGKQIGGR